MFRAYFSEGQNISDDSTLRSLLSEVGIEEDVAMSTLSSTEAIKQYEEEVKEAGRKGKWG